MNEINIDNPRQAIKGVALRVSENTSPNHQKFPSIFYSADL